MIYLDYSATTPVNEEVLKTFNKVCTDYIGNPNSLHKLGVEAKRLMDKSSEIVADLLKVKPNEVIFTSGASEANSLAILGVLEKYSNRGKHIITTHLEHSSILETMNYLEKKGYIIDYVKINDNGLVDLDDLKRLLSDDTILVSITHVNSEMGLIEPIEKIANIVHQYKRTIFHVDGTQAIGKIKVDLNNIDLYSFSAHKIYGLKGVGCLIKKQNIELEPMIHGGKSQTIYRSGTPSLGLIVSLTKALKLVLNDFDQKYLYVKNLNNKLINGLKKLDVTINSNEFCVPHIVNFSVLGLKAETVLHALEENNIYISTKTACSKEDESISVLAKTKNHDLAKTSLRVSLSFLTKEEEIDFFLEKLSEILNNLQSIRG